MTYVFNVLYLLLLVLLSPWLLYRALRRGRYRRGLGAKFLGRVSHSLLKPVAYASGSDGSRSPCAWFHGVSVGEVHLLRQVVALARRRNPHWRIVVSTSTDTGYDEACRVFGDLPVVFWPLDFSWAIKTALGRVKPDLVVLAEGEIWPNFLRIAKRRGVKLALLNGRMSPRSARRFRRIAWLARALFSRFDVILAQNAEYGENYRTLGGRGVVVTGNVKYDGAATERDNPRTLQMRRVLGIGSEELVWVAGSTQAPEEEIALGIYRKARERFPHVRLIVVPRQKDRFESVGRLIEQSGFALVRRSGITAEAGVARALTEDKPVLLIDTIGELGAVWGLADVAFVGGSMDGKRGGQNMIEPAAYGAAVTFGPYVWNFKEPVARLLERSAAVQVQVAAELERVTLELLADAEQRRELGERARAFVLSQQGATERSVKAFEGLLTMSVERIAA